MNMHLQDMLNFNYSYGCKFKIFMEFPPQEGLAGPPFPQHGQGGLGHLQGRGRRGERAHQGGTVGGEKESIMIY